MQRGLYRTRRRRCVGVILRGIGSGGVRLVRGQLEVAITGKAIAQVHNGIGGIRDLDFNVLRGAGVAKVAVRRHLITDKHRRDFRFPTGVARAAAYPDIKRDRSTVSPLAARSEALTVGNKTTGGAVTVYGN